MVSSHGCACEDGREAVPPSLVGTLPIGMTMLPAASRRSSIFR